MTHQFFKEWAEGRQQCLAVMPLERHQVPATDTVPMDKSDGHGDGCEVYLNDTSRDLMTD